MLAAGPSPCDAGAAAGCVGGIDCAHIWQKACIFMPQTGYCAAWEVAIYVKGLRLGIWKMRSPWVPT